MKKVLISCFLLCTLSVLSQERIDIFTMAGRYGLQSPYDPELPKEAGERAALLNLKVPVILSDKTIWYSNFTYTFSMVENGMTFPDSMVNPIRLHGFIFQTGLVQKLGAKDAFQILFVPRYMSDLVEPTDAAWQLGAIVLYEHRFGPRLRLRLGAMYNEEKSGPLIVPLIDVNWQISDRWSLTGLFPIYGKLNYKASKSLTLGLSHFGLITSYELTNPNYAGDYMERTSIDLTAFARVKLFGNWFAEGRFGYALGRNYEQYKEDDKIDWRVSIARFGDNRDQPRNYTFEDGLIGSFRIVYSLPLPN